MKNALQNIKLSLEEMGLQVELTSIAGGLPVKQLTVTLEELGGLKLVIFFLSDLLKAARGYEEQASALADGETDFLQLFIRFPFELQESAYPDLARLILMINWSTPVGSFGLNEAQKNLYYRQVFECLGDPPHPGLVAETAGAMQFYAAQRFDLLKAVATGEQTLARALAELESEGRREETFPGYDS